MQTKTISLRTNRHEDMSRLGTEIEAWTRDNWALISHTTTPVPYSWSGKGLKATEHTLVFQRETPQQAHNPARRGPVQVTYGRS